MIEFCSDSNHDPDQDIQQEIRNGDSCWETIVARPGYTGRTAPDPAGPGPTTGFTPPDWIFLEKQPRFAVMVDRSGSMSADGKMVDARHGAVYWLEYCSVGNDLLSVVSYDDQIESLPTRAAVQVGLLITDGIHNFPAGSSPVEALEDYQEGGIRLYTLGVGQSGAVDLEVLDSLATGTSGRLFAVGDNQPSVIENAMIELSAEVRGGRLDKLVGPLLERGKDRCRRIVAPHSRSCSRPRA